MIIGLTGGIGSGKSTVAKVFETMSCAIYNSDDRAKDLYFIPKIKEAIIKLLGKESYLSETQIDKNYISKKVFSNTDILFSLNAIIHPAVKDDFISYIKKFPSNTIIIKESALLFETGFHKDLNQTILVTAPLNLKIDRVIKRNAISKAEVEIRMKAQWTDEQKMNLADHIVINDNVTPLIPQVISIITKLNNNA